MMLRNKQVEIYYWREGTNYRHITASIEYSGDLAVSGNDGGENLPVFADDDYEYVLTVPCAEKEKVLFLLESLATQKGIRTDDFTDEFLNNSDNRLLILIKLLFCGNDCAPSNLRKLLEEQNILCSFWCY